MSELSGGHPESMMFAQTKMTMSKPPPPNVEIPNGKVFNLVLVHQQEIYPISVTMFYSINTKFDKNPCGVVEEKFFDPKSLIPFGLVMFGIGLVYFLVRDYYNYRVE